MHYEKVKSWLEPLLFSGYHQIYGHIRRIYTVLATPTKGLGDRAHQIRTEGAGVGWLALEEVSRT